MAVGCHETCVGVGAGGSDHNRGRIRGQPHNAFGQRSIIVPVAGTSVLKNTKTTALVFIRKAVLYDGIGNATIQVEAPAIRGTGRSFVSVRNAMDGASLGQLHESIEKEFKELDDNEKNVSAVMAKMESSFMLRLKKFQQQ